MEGRLWAHPVGIQTWDNKEAAGRCSPSEKRHQEAIHECKRCDMDREPPHGVEGAPGKDQDGSGSPQEPGRGTEPRALQAPELTAHLKRNLVAACCGARRGGRGGQGKTRRVMNAPPRCPSPSLTSTKGSAFSVPDSKGVRFAKIAFTVKPIHGSAPPAGGHP